MKGVRYLVSGDRCRGGFGAFLTPITCHLTLVLAEKTPTEEADVFRRGERSLFKDRSGTLEALLLARVRADVAALTALPFVVT
jgi:hypothetical protein